MEWSFESLTSSANMGRQWWKLVRREETNAVDAHAEDGEEAIEAVDGLAPVSFLCARRRSSGMKAVRSRRQLIQG